jgi:preprotein translocase subunit SecG
MSDCQSEIRQLSKETLLNSVSFYGARAISVEFIAWTRVRTAQFSGFPNFHPRYFMSALFISLLTLVLILISAFVILLVLMQRTSQSGGMGAALGGGAAESAFGSDTSSILTKSTIYGIIAFFVVALGLFLIYQSEASNRTQIVSAGELISAEEVAPAVEPVVGDTAGTIEVGAPVVDAEASTTSN